MQANIQTLFSVQAKVVLLDTALQNHRSARSVAGLCCSSILIELPSHGIGSKQALRQYNEEGCEHLQKLELYPHLPSLMFVPNLQFILKLRLVMS